MSPFIMNVCACCIVIFINYQLLSHGDDYSVGAFGIINRVQMLFVMIVMGIAQECSRLRATISAPGSLTAPAAACSSVSPPDAR